MREKIYKINPHGFFNRTFAHVLTIFCTFAACACCAYFKLYKLHISNYINKEGNDVIPFFGDTVFGKSAAKKLLPDFSTGTME
jgi:hypothetical protein